MNPNKENQILSPSLNSKPKLSDNGTCNRFDEGAATWDDKPQRRILAQKVAECMAKQLGLDQQTALTHNAMEFGCGTGLVSFLLRDKLKHIIAIDSSAGMIATLKEKIATANIANIEAVCLEISQDRPSKKAISAPFDLIYSNMTFHHLEDIPNYLRLLHGFLKPGGRIAISDLDLEDGSFHPDKSGVFHYGFNRPQLESWLLENGFQQANFFTAHNIIKDIIVENGQSDSRNYSIFLAIASSTN